VLTQQALAEIDREIIAASQSQEVLDRVCRQAAALLHVPKAAIATMDGSGLMRVSASFGFLDATASMDEFLRLQKMGLFPGRQQGVFSVDEIHPGNPFMPEFCAREGICAVSMAPLTAQGQRLGMLAVFDTRPHAWSQDEQQTLSFLGGQTALALQKTQLHEQTEQRLQRLTALRTIDQAISTSLDLRLTLNILLGQITTQLGVDAAAILRYNPILQTLEFAAGNGFHSTAVERLHLRLGEGLAGAAALERRVVHVDNLEDPMSGAVQAQLFAAEKFSAYYGVPLLAKGKLLGVLDVFHRSPLAPDQDWLDYLESLAGQAAIAVENANLFDNLQRSNAELSLAYEATIEGWSQALDLRDQETEGHTQRVAELTQRLGISMHLSDIELVHLRRGALLHDIGKIAVPDEILRKPGPLTEEEWLVMRLHPLTAFRLLSPIHYLQPSIDIPYCHHEKWDGTGYPRHLKGEEIPLMARIFAAVDVWDALTSDRPYRPAWSKERALDYIRAQSDLHFDPRVVNAFLNILEKAAP
jgi:HD-GYP domain-containing protein (c-di-GMP phosphodiesterase class II)